MINNSHGIAVQNSTEHEIDEALTNLPLIAGNGSKTEPSTSQRTTDNAAQQRQMSRAKSAADMAILDAERFKAQINPPNRGINFNNTPSKMDRVRQKEIQDLRNLDNDDEFFHTTCHIETALKEKIEKGDFVELDKLMQKKLQYRPQDNRMQLINKDGMSYFVPPVDRDTKIDNIKKWEQAFRVYTTIYCNANPSRSGEILQYVDIIHRAAAIFNWDNVARYDYVMAAINGCQTIEKLG